jgi:hypothetical protein
MRGWQRCWAASCGPTQTRLPRLQPCPLWLPPASNTAYASPRRSCSVSLLLPLITSRWPPQKDHTSYVLCSAHHDSILAHACVHDELTSPSHVHVAAQRAYQACRRVQYTSHVPATSTSCPMGSGQASFLVMAQAWARAGKLLPWSQKICSGSVESAG